MDIISCMYLVSYLQYNLHFRHPGTAKEVIVSESMSLTQFIERYSKDLPLQIKVLRGYCGSTSRLTSKYCVDLFTI